MAFLRTVAGAEANVAVGVARLGHSVRYLGRVGDDAFGTVIRRKLRGEGRYHGGDELKPGGATVRSRGGQPVIDGPYPEAKEAIGGYFLVEAADLAEAGRIATECPVLDHGGCVEVREISG